MKISYDVPTQVLHQLLDPVPLPEMALLHYAMQTPAPIADIEAAVRAELRRPEVRSLIKPGQRIAIGVGSRGIARLHEIVRALVVELRAIGAEPFIIPAMGSHGGATAEGQREVLAHLNISEATVGAPVISQMDTREVGRTHDGIPVRVDSTALDADGIVFVGRVKPHTAFRGTHESGLAKMIAIGLGKQAGAAACHAAGFGDMGRRVPLLAEVALAKAPIRFGLAVLENGYDQPYKVVVVPADRLLRDEPALLVEAKAAMPRIPFDQIDVLVIDEIGKNISGDGADPNITGRYPTPFASGGPTVNKLVMLDLTAATDGNGNGLGMADYTTARAAQKMNWARTYPNALTSTVALGVSVPMVVLNDRQAFAAALLTCNVVGREPYVVRIKNTLHLEHFWVSASLLDQAGQTAGLSVVNGPAPIPFNEEGQLPELEEQTLAAALPVQAH